MSESMDEMFEAELRSSMPKPLSIEDIPSGEPGDFYQNIVNPTARYKKMLNPNVWFLLSDGELRQRDEDLRTIEDAVAEAGITEEDIVEAFQETRNFESDVLGDIDQLPEIGGESDQWGGVQWKGLPLAEFHGLKKGNRAHG